MNDLVVVRGGGDIATGTIYKLRRCGFRVIVTEIARPSAIRRNVAFCEAVYGGVQTVEDMVCRLAADTAEAVKIADSGDIAVIVDPGAECVKELAPVALADAVLAKRNTGLKIGMCPVTIALGPGFQAGIDADAVIETMRGHNLGRVIYKGSAMPDTGVPGIIAGYGRERVIHSPAEGVMKNIAHITDTVAAGDIIAEVLTNSGAVPVKATIGGILRGLIRDGYPVTKGFKIADIDPRAEEYSNCFTISDKARCIAGGVLEALMYLMEMKKLW